MVVIFTFVLFLSGLVVPAFADGRVHVTASVLPIWVFTKNVAGDRADVSLLVPPGTDIHEYSLSPRDVKGLYDTDLVIMNGLGLEPFLDRLPGSIKVFETSTGYSKAPADPHVWLDPLKAIEQVNAIAGALAGIDPEGKDHYEDNARTYGLRLEKLNVKIAQLLAPFKGTPLVTYHESFTYFAARYGLESYSLTGPSAEQPLPRRMKRVYDIIRQKNVPAVFAEELYPPEILQRLTYDLAVQVCPLGTVTTGQQYTGLYEQVMMENAETILRCLVKGD